MGRLVQGQVTHDGVNGQATGRGFQAQGPGNAGDLLSGVTGSSKEGQLADNDVQGQINDELPFSRTSPGGIRAKTNPDVGPGANRVRSPLTLSSTRRTGGSKKR